MSTRGWHRLVHGHNRAYRRTAAYNAWSSMIQRTRNPNNADYPRYGGRGILVCDRWLVFANFLADMGQPPAKGLMLDRRDNDGPYSPDNCRWATRTEQNRNKRSVLLTADKVAELRRRHAAGDSSAALASELGMSPRTIWRAVTGRTWA